MTSMRSVVLAVLVALLGAGCAAHVPMAPKELDVAAKQFTTTPDRATLYIYRNEAFAGLAVSLGLMLDGDWLGESVAKSYFMVPVQPGPHVLVSKGEGTNELRFDAQAGKNYFVWQEVKMGMASARSALHLVDESTGRAGVLECELAIASDKVLAGKPGCVKDTECKGDRVCERGICVEPRAPGMPTR